LQDKNSENSLEIEEISENQEVKEKESPNNIRELKLTIEPRNMKPAPLAFHILTW
jgi:hypothetical protein